MCADKCGTDVACKPSKREKTAILAELTLALPVRRDEGIGWRLIKEMKGYVAACRMVDVTWASRELVTSPPQSKMELR